MCFFYFFVARARAWGAGRGVWGEGYVGVNGDSKFVGDGGGLIFRILQVVTVVGYGLGIVRYVSYTNDRPAIYR